MNTTGGIETVLYAHRGIAHGPEEVVCACNETWKPYAEHRAHVAAAVRAHLLSDAVVERAANAISPREECEHEKASTNPTWCVTCDARAALAAAVGGDTDG